MAEERGWGRELTRGKESHRAGGAYARDYMIDTKHPIVKQLVADGYRISVHAYLRDCKTKTTVAAKHPETGKLLQGWARDGSLDGALVDLAERSGVMTRRTS